MILSQKRWLKLRKFYARKLGVNFFLNEFESLADIADLRMIAGIV